MPLLEVIFNTYIGYLAEGDRFLENATAIGANAFVTTSNTIQLGDSNVTLVQTSGTVSAAAFVGGWVWID